MAKFFCKSCGLEWCFPNMIQEEAVESGFDRCPKCSRPSASPLNIMDVIRVEARRYWEAKARKEEQSA